MDSGSDSKRSLRSITILALTVLGILVLGDLSRRMGNARQLEQDTLVLQTEVAALESQNVALSTQIAVATSDAVVEAWARQTSRMVREGERLIVPIPAPGSESIVQPTPTPLPDRPTNWDVWWALLFSQ
jgi:cell division protein FtsB